LVLTTLENRTIFAFTRAREVSNAPAFNRISNGEYIQA